MRSKDGERNRKIRIRHRIKIKQKSCFNIIQSKKEHVRKRGKSEKRVRVLCYNKASVSKREKRISLHYIEIKNRKKKEE